MKRPIPIACTLTASELPDRLAQWRSVVDRAVEHNETADGVELFSEPRIAASMRGTGCTLAMALACELANGTPLRHAVHAARAYVRAEIARH